MRVAVDEVEGVADATVSLDDGVVVVSLEDSNEVRLVRLRSVIRDQGFTPKEANVRVRALVREAAGGFVLEVPGSGESFRVEGEAADLAPLDGQVGKTVVVRGRVGEDTSDRIHLTSVAAGSGAEPAP